MSDVEHPHHYNQGDIECWDAMISAFGTEKVKTYCVLNAFKYVWRHDEKGDDVKDLGKAIIYLEKYISLS